MPLRIYASRTLSAANIVIFLVGAAVVRDVVLHVALPPAGARLLADQGRAGVPADDALHRRRLDARLARGDPSRRQAAADRGDGLAGGGAALVHRHHAERRLPRRGAGAVAARRDGIGLAFVPATIAAVAGVAPHEAGLASGLVNTSRLFGGALGLAILAALATARTNSDVKAAGGHVTTRVVHAALTSGFQIAFIVAAIFAAVGAVIAVFGLPRIRARAARSQSAAVDLA